MAMGSSRASAQGPPFVPTTAMPGLRPNVKQDVAPSAVFLAIWIASAVAHQTIFQINRKRGHFFPMSWAMFGFSMARVATMTLRIAWACKPNNPRLAMAAIIFLNAGVLIYYVVVLLLSLRLFRGMQPRLGWNTRLDRAIKVNYCVLCVFILLIIAFVVVEFYVLDPTILKAALWIIRAGTIYFVIFNLIAPVLLLLAVLLPRSAEAENFGVGSMQAKIIIVGVSIFFSLFESGFRTATSWVHARPLSDPAWYDTRPAFYIIELGIEIIVTWFLLLTRIDKRFWIPNRSRKPGDYSGIISPENHQGSPEYEELQGTGSSSEKSNAKSR